MGFLQEAAIMVGDKITQPAKARLVSLVTGRPTTIEKEVIEGPVGTDGRIYPTQESFFPLNRIRLQLGQPPVILTGKRGKKVEWRIIHGDEK